MPEQALSPDLRGLREDLAAVVRSLRQASREATFDGQQSWSLATLAARHDCSEQTIRRVLQSLGMRSTRGRNLLLTRDQVRRLDEAMVARFAPQEVPDAAR